MSKIKSFLDILRSRFFIFQLLLALAVSVLIIFGTMLYLEKITLHGEEITVPDLHGLDKKDLKEFLTEKNLKFIVVDSTYIGEEEKGLVVGQNPAAMSKVKKNRTIYITINAMNPPSVRLPLLIDKSMRQAVSIIESLGLKVGELLYRPDQCVNCVLDMKMNGQSLKNDTVIQKGMKVDLVLGSGLSSEKVLVPLVVNMKRDEVIETLKKSYLNLGIEIYDNTVYDDEDSLNARVIYQTPAYGIKSWLPMGSPVDVEYTMLHNNIDTNIVILDSTLLKTYIPDDAADTIK